MTPLSAPHTSILPVAFQPERSLPLNRDVNPSGGLTSSERTGPTMIAAASTRPLVWSIRMVKAPKRQTPPKRGESVGLLDFARRDGQRLGRDGAVVVLAAPDVGRLQATGPRWLLAAGQGDGDLGRFARRLAAGRFAGAVGIVPVRVAADGEDGD